jgi:VWFA-related protein
MKIYLIVVFTFLISFSTFGQTPLTAPSPEPGKTKERDDEIIRVNTVLLNLPIIASDRDGRNIIGLTKEDFIVTQNGEKQPIEFFSDVEAPINVAIMVDTSGSTAPILGNIKKAARTFLRTLRPEDKAMIVSFDGQIKVLSELTSDQKNLKKAIDRLALVQMEGTTMYDAIDEIINHKFGAVKGRKAIILLTDGTEFGDRIKKPELMRMLTESETVIYPILFLFKLPGKDSPLESMLKHMPEMAEATGGKLYYGGSDLQKAFQSIADELKKQYLIGFYPQNSEAGGEPLDIKINIGRENVVLRTKRKIRLKANK